MQQNRREFMQTLGVALGAAVLSGCTSIKLPWSGGDKDDWDRLRGAWAGLDQLATDAQDMEKGEKTRNKLIADHLAALDGLVKSGQLEAATADDIHLAFQAAAQHVWRAHAPITCYKPAPYPQYRVMSASDLAEQSEILAEMASRSGINASTVAQAQASIERDLAYLSLSSEDEQALIATLQQSPEGIWAFGTLESLNLRVPPEATAAARVLIDALLGKK